MRARAPPAPSDIIGLTLQAVANRHDPAAAMAGQAWNRPWLRPAHDLWRHFDLPGFAGETLPGPAVAAIEVKRRGDVRRAKLYYLRDRRGKSARIAEKQETVAERTARVEAKTAKKAKEKAAKIAAGK
jgi:hypothetical protein